MRVKQIVPGAVALVLGGAGQAAAQQPVQVAPSAVLDAAVVEHATHAELDRARLQALLQRPEVREIAAANAIDMQRVQDAAVTLGGIQLQMIAPHLQAAENALAGGQSITISTTMIIIALLVIILLVLIV
ncbi:MAG: hypothetical protein ACREKM_11860 [Longimicrobiales bacterium]